MRHDALKFFADYIEAQLGIVYSPDNYFQLENRLQDLAKKLGLPGVEALHQRMLSESGFALREELLDIATNNETSFFRDVRVFNGLREFVIPKLVAKNRPLKIWSAAASTGQEALSVAIVLTELAAQYPGLRFEILATDFSTRVLKRIEEGYYSDLEVNRGLPKDLLSKYFQQKDGRWLVSPQLRASIKTARLNLCGSMNLVESMDVVLCRNVLIYQKVTMKIEIVKKIESRVAPGGFVILGAGESLLGLSQSFSQHEFNNAIFYQKVSSPT